MSGRNEVGEIEFVRIETVIARYSIKADEITKKALIRRLDDCPEDQLNDLLEEMNFAGKAEHLSEEVEGFGPVDSYSIDGVEQFSRGDAEVDADRILAKLLHESPTVSAALFSRALSPLVLRACQEEVEGLQGDGPRSLAFLKDKEVDLEGLGDKALAEAARGHHGEALDWAQGRIAAVQGEKARQLNSEGARHQLRFLVERSGRSEVLRLAREAVEELAPEAPGEGFSP